MRKKTGALIWLAGVVGFSVFVGFRLLRDPAIDTDLLALLPASETSSLIREANTLLSNRASHLMVFLTGHPMPDVTEQLHQRLNQELGSSDLVKSNLSNISPEQQQAFYDLYFPFRYQILSPGDRLRLKEKLFFDQLMGRLKGSLYSPASSMMSSLIPQDPFLFFPHLLQSWMAGATPPPALPLMGRGPDNFSFEVVEVGGDPFDSKDQDRMMGWVEHLQKQFGAEFPGSRVVTAGVLPFARAERFQIEKEMAMISLGSLIGVLILLKGVFISIRSLFLATVPILIGFLAATAATLAVFGKIHVITLAFGSTLIGVAVDYPFHYMAHHRMAVDGWNAETTYKQIFPGLIIGALTSVMGYAGLSFAPFPGLRQIALFSSVGLSAALITVLLWLPAFLNQAPTLKNTPRWVSIGEAYVRSWCRWKDKSQRGKFLLGLAGFLVISLGGVFKIRFDDSIRRFQQLPNSVAKDAEIAQQVVKGWGGNRFIAIEGATLEELFQRQEILQEKLQTLVAAGKIASVQSLAPFLPSRLSQEQDRRLIQDAFLPRATLVKGKFHELGLSPEVAMNLWRDLQIPLTYFSFDSWFKSQASQVLRSLWIGSTANGVASAALVGGLVDTSALRQALSEMAGVRFFDQIEEYSNLFRQYRRKSISLILAAYVFVCGLMMVRFGFKGGAMVMIPSLAAVLLTFALLGWCGVRLHLFYCLSALLILSMGSDYSIYFAEAARTQTPVGPTFLSVSLCAFSTMLSFGLLALCRTPVLSSIGLTVFVGITLAYLFSPLPYAMSRVQTEIL